MNLSLKPHCSLKIQISILIFMFVPGLLFAQDHNPWNHQYGSRSALMSGAVVGGVNDSSATFYNPGVLATLREESLSVSANALQYESLSVRNGAGEGKRLESDEIQIVPLLISGIQRFESLPDHAFGYSLLTRNSTSTSFSARTDTFMDVVSVTPFGFELFPGEENYIGQYASDSQLNEYWAGLTWSYQVNNSLSVGVTNYLALRDQQRTLRESARAINPLTLNAATTDIFERYDATSLSLLWKFGVAYQLEGAKFGLTVTTPNMHLWGDGTVERDLTVTGYDFLTEDGAQNSLVANDRQDSLNARYRTPVSIAAGVELDLAESTTLGLSAEWFAPVGEYGVLRARAEDFVRPSGVDFEIGGSDEFLRVVDTASNVFNVGVGLEQRFTDRFNGYLGFRTDMSTFRSLDTSGIQVGTSDWDLYHTSIGGTYRFENSMLALGLEYSYGRNSRAFGETNIVSPTQEGLLFGEDQEARYRYSAVRAILGYTYFFDVM